MLEPLVTWLAYRFVNFIINVIWGISLAIWYIEKAIAWLGDQIVTSNIWETIIEGMLTGLATSMPATLQSVMFGAGGGLFYLALILFGLMLIIPFISRVQPVLEVERVFGWTLFVVVLFVSSTSGYDLIGIIEQGRMGMMANIASGHGSNEVSQLVAGPMSATAGEINVNEFELPVAYQNIYFPDPAAFETLEIVWIDGNAIFGGKRSTVTVETNDSLDNRIGQAALGIVLVILNLIPTAMVVILVASFVGLTATSLVLLLFFLMALPLGMFESGMLVITQIVRRYMLVWILSIFMAVFPGTLLGVAELTLVPPINLESLFLYVGVLLVAVYATYHVARWIFNIATESFSVIGQSINTVAFGGSGGGQAGGMVATQNSGAPIPNRLPPAGAIATIGAAAMAPAMIQQGVGMATLAAKALPPVIGGAIARQTFGRVSRNNPVLPMPAFGASINTGEQPELIHQMSGVDPASMKANPILKESAKEFAKEGRTARREPEKKDANGAGTLLPMMGGADWNNVEVKSKKPKGRKKEQEALLPMLENQDWNNVKYEGEDSYFELKEVSEEGGSKDK